MRARQLIQSAGYGPDQLRIIFRAFDNVWDQVAGGLGSDPQAIETARARLASIILTLAEREPLDLADLHDQALDRFNQFP